MEVLEGVEAKGTRDELLDGRMERELGRKGSSRKDDVAVMEWRGLVDGSIPNSDIRSKELKDGKSFTENLPKKIFSIVIRLSERSNYHRPSPFRLPRKKEEKERRGIPLTSSILFSFLHSFICFNK